jgi:hypothetical protein
MVLMGGTQEKRFRLLLHFLKKVTIILNYLFGITIRDNNDDLP